MAGGASKETLAEIRRLLTNVGRRLENIEGMGNPSPAIETFLDIQNKFLGEELGEISISRLRSALREMDEKTATSLLRNLKYVDRLKTSTVRGAKSYNDRIRPVLERYERWDEATKAKFREIYRKTFMESGYYLEKFKYDIFELAANAIEFEDPDKLPIAVQETLIALLKEGGDTDVSEREFSSKLSEFL